MDENAPAAEKPAVPRKKPQPPLHGRRKGTLNRLTIARMAIGKDVFRSLHDGIPELNVPPMIYRWARILNDRNVAIRANFERFLYEAEHGRAKQQVNVSGSMDLVASVRRAAAIAYAANSDTPALPEEPAVEAEIVEHVKAEIAGGNGNGHEP